MIRRFTSFHILYYADSSEISPNITSNFSTVHNQAPPNPSGVRRTGKKNDTCSARGCVFLASLIPNALLFGCYFPPFCVWDFEMIERCAGTICDGGRNTHPLVNKTFVLLRKCTEWGVQREASLTGDVDAVNCERYELLAISSWSEFWFVKIHYKTGNCYQFEVLHILTWNFENCVPKRKRKKRS